MSEVPTPAKGGKKPNPFVLSFVACDDIIPDSRNGNHSIINVYHDILSPSYPCMRQQLAIFVELTDGHGLTSLEIRLIHEPTLTQVVSMQGTADFPDPRAVASLCFQVSPIVFAMPGEYRLQLFGQNELIIERRITAHLVDAGSERTSS